MMGLLKPSSGNVYFNNSNISKINQEWIKNISYVSQNVFLLDDTVEKNITFNFDNSNVDKNKIEKALEIAELSPKILSLPNGIYEKVGVDGLKFSGGERQRLAIARAVYKEAPILFLDEFTSSLDVLTEEKILKNFKNHFSDKTIILITHRQNTIEKCDKLWELKNLNTDHEN
jgi:ABC-type multidrug transport system fused ATPase/permease subunit